MRFRKLALIICLASVVSVQAVGAPVIRPGDRLIVYVEFKGCWGQLYDYGPVRRSGKIKLGKTILSVEGLRTDEVADLLLASFNARSANEQPRVSVSVQDPKSGWSEDSYRKALERSVRDDRCSGRDPYPTVPDWGVLHRVG